MSLVSEQARTHDSVSTKAYWIGFVEGRVQTCVDFSIDVPTSALDTILGILQREPVDIDIGAPEIRKFMVSWTHIDVRFIV